MYSRIELLEPLVVCQRDSRAPRPIASGARLARLGPTQLLCTYMIQEALGRNDFHPVASRSQDLGRTWSAPAPLWPEHGAWDSIFGSVSPRRDALGRLVFWGMRFTVDQPGETTWQEANFGFKQNELIYATSEDDGWTWSCPQVIPKPTVGSCEAPGAMCLTRGGRWLACYSVYNSFDRTVHAPHQQWWSVRSDDQGASWQSSLLATFGATDGTAESWIVELSDGRLLGACWRTSHADASDYPTPYVLSSDGGVTWSPPRELGIRAQSIALAALPHGQALLIYNQRRQEPAGVRLALLDCTGEGLRVVCDELIWSAATTRQTDAGSAGLDGWTNFSFGEPSVLPLDEGEALAVLWCAQPAFHGVPGVRLRLH